MMVFTAVFSIFESPKRGELLRVTLKVAKSMSL